jgi:ribosome-binding factor A
MSAHNQDPTHNRSHRVGDLLLEFLGKLLVRELGDPRVRAVTLTGIDVRRDLKHVTVYFTIRGGQMSSEGVGEGQTSSAQAVKGLTQATGFIRTKIARELQLRFVPTMAFVFDETPDRAQRIDYLLRDLDPK